MPSAASASSRTCSIGTTPSSSPCTRRIGRGGTLPMSASGRISRSSRRPRLQVVRELAIVDHADLTCVGEEAVGVHGPVRGVGRRRTRRPPARGDPRPGRADGEGPALAEPGGQSPSSTSAAKQGVDCRPDVGEPAAQREVARGSARAAEVEREHGPAQLQTVRRSASSPGLPAAAAAPAGRPGNRGTAPGPGARRRRGDAPDRRSIAGRPPRAAFPPGRTTRQTPNSRRAFSRSTFSVTSADVERVQRGEPLSWRDERVVGPEQHAVLQRPLMLRTQVGAATAARRPARQIDPRVRLVQRTPRAARPATAMPGAPSTICRSGKSAATAST